MSDVFDESQAESLTCVLDALIPPDAESGLPGAGELGVLAAVEEAVRRSPDLEPALVQGLTALEERAREHGAARFADLEPARRAEVLSDVAGSQPAFLPGLVFHGYTSYYQHPRVLEALGVPARAPFPDGYPIEPTDYLSLLEEVRRRERLYR